jgi:hypothetical protein
MRQPALVAYMVRFGAKADTRHIAHYLENMNLCLTGYHSR